MNAAVAVDKQRVRCQKIGVLRVVLNSKTHNLCVIFGVCVDSGKLFPHIIFRFSLDNVVGLNNIVKRHIKMTL